MPDNYSVCAHVLSAAVSGMCLQYKYPFATIGFSLSFAEGVTGAVAQLLEGEDEDSVLRDAHYNVSEVMRRLGTGLYGAEACLILGYTPAEAGLINLGLPCLELITSGPPRLSNANNLLSTIAICAAAHSLDDQPFGYLLAAAQALTLHREFTEGNDDTYVILGALSVIACVYFLTDKRSL